MRKSKLFYSVVNAIKIEPIMNLAYRFLPTILLFIVFTACSNSSIETDDSTPIYPQNNYKTKNVVVIIMDGARYSETWGDITQQYIPKISGQLASKGIINTSFYNNGPTWTISGHAAITTGHYQDLNNSGKEIPKYSSIFQNFRKAKNVNAASTWMISSKDKLEVLNNCVDSNWKNKYQPNTNCGVNGLGSGYREDAVTFEKISEILSKDQPQLTLINLREPDFSGHTGNWNDYLDGLRASDEYIYQIWQFLENNPFYQGKTSLFITNDHGRHLDDLGGFSSHGDDCDGCRHILFYAHGPDFKQNTVIDIKRELIDIPSTIAELLGFPMPDRPGKVMTELFLN
ncbi:alkaline phosphatase family protein [Arenibacter sp. S6351L]|uniref:alkaline phosphatase family protein n=1 Tax=Arenibacter sp. S6351L TaxID=2926407 RepID=UPI001FF1A6BE|nr:alkaline phosphatase family protein [Arenibacter sp. S6351L]MCK0132717.1 alkaline phosphatase family protein [Arenibacter sp. S6351L]